MLAFGSGDRTSLDKLVAPILVRRFGDPPQVPADQRWSAGQIGRYLAQFLADPRVVEIVTGAAAGIPAKMKRCISENAAALIVMPIALPTRCDNSRSSHARKCSSSKTALSVSK